MLPKRQASINVLIVDDDPVDRQLIEAAFKEEADRVKIRQCANAEEAMAYLKREGEYATAPRPHACILDINMPKISGLELLKQIKADPDLRNISVVMMSGSDQYEDIELSYNLQAAFYIRKPENYRDLRSTVAKVTDLWTRVVAFPGQSELRA